MSNQSTPSRTSPGRSRTPLQKYKYPGRPERSPSAGRAGSVGRTVKYQDDDLEAGDGADAETGILPDLYSDDEVEDKPLYESERYLDVTGVTTVVDKFKVNRRGYRGLITFVIFAALYFVNVHLQRNNLHIGMENRGLRMPLYLKKPHAKVTTRSGFWSFLSGSILPYATQGNRWEAEVHATDDKMRKKMTKAGSSQFIMDAPMNMAGYNAMQYSSIIGGIAILQTRSKTKTCPVNMFSPPLEAGQQCYDEEESSSEDFQITGKATDPASGVTKELKMTIPYDKGSDAYVTMLPATASQAELSALLTYFQEASLIDDKTRGIEVRMAVYNGNTDVIGILSWTLEIDLSGHIPQDLVSSSIPYFLYKPDDWHFTAAVQIVFLLWVSMMINNLMKSYLRTWPLPDMISHWKIVEPDDSPMPCNDAGRTYIHTAGMLYFTIIIETGMWIYLNYLYKQMHHETAFDMSKAQQLYGLKTDLFDMEKHAKPFMQLVVPYMDMIAQLKWMFDAYFYTCGFTTVLFIFRMFEYLDFQGKLNAITQTFKVGVGELLHLLLVLNVVVIGFSFLGYILFGSQVKAFKTFISAFVSVWEMCFGLFKLKPIQIKYYNPAAGYLYEFMFRMLITMLLLKMVVAIIFDAYKSTAIKTRKTAPTVPADLRRLWFHSRNYLMGGDGYVEPDAISRFMHSSSVRMVRGADGVLRERKVITEKEMPKLFKKVMKKEIPDIMQAAKNHVKCDWILERYGRIRCVYSSFGEMPASQIKKVKEIYKRYDLDSSGTISTSEFALALADLEHPLAHDSDYVMKSLKVVDVDKSGEIEWEEFLMYSAHEAGMTVPPALLPTGMVAAQAQIQKSYAALKEETLNDASGSIWDSNDSMSKGGAPTAPQAAGSGGGGGGGADVEKMCKTLTAKIADQAKMIQKLQDMVDAPVVEDIGKYLN